MRKINSILWMFLISSTSFSQTFDNKNYEKYEINKLPVFFIIPDSKENNTKEEMSNLVANYWMDKNYKILTKEEARKLIKQGENGVLAEFQGCYYTSTRNGFYSATSNRFIMEYKGKAILTILIEDNISKADVVYAFRQVQFIIKNRLKFKKSYVWSESASLYGDLLKKKTLLISKNDIRENKIEEIKEVYPYNILIVDEAEKTEKILSGDEKYLTINYGNYLWSDGKTSSFKILYSISDGTIVSFSMPQVSFGGLSSSHLLKVKDFKNFIKECK